MLFVPMLPVDSTKRRPCGSDQLGLMTPSDKIQHEARTVHNQSSYAHDWHRAIRTKVLQTQTVCSPWFNLESTVLGYMRF